MDHKKFHNIRLVFMIIGSILNIGFIACCVIAIINSSNEHLRNILLPIIISYVILCLVFYILLGRLFCGFLCPLGLFQDILWKITNKLHLPQLPRDSKFMKVINAFNIFLLIVFLGVIIALIILLAFFSDILAKIKFPMLILYIVPIVMITLNSMARRFFCNVCPLGSFIGLFRKINFVKLKKDNDACTSCGACYESCPMRIESIYLEKEKIDISTSKCIYCGECIKKCPKDNALSITIRNKIIYKSSTEDFLNTQSNKKGKENEQGK